MSSIVWAYIRVSGDEQADRGLPVAGQRRAIEEYAREHLAVITKHWNEHWQALALCETTGRPRVLPERQREKIASYMRSMAREMGEIREMLRGELG